jgi:regulator of protease activity HflC (stomatin/prohibitin superfamily)
LKRSELIAFWVWIALLAVTVFLTIGAIKYGPVCFWAGALAALGQALLAAMAWWGLRLGREQAALVEEATVPKHLTPVAPLGTFHMSYSDDATIPTPVEKPATEPDEIMSLDTGFQRVIVGLCGLAFLALAAIIGWLVYRNFAAVTPGHSIVISPVPIDPGAVVAVGASLLVYLILMSATRITRETEGYLEATNSIVLLGVPVIVVVAAGVLAAWANTAYASQGAAIVVALILTLQALELLINSIGSQSGMDEMDQDMSDLQRLPLVPLLTSGWITGLKLLMSEVLGIGVVRRDEPGHLSRLLPRAVIAGAIVVLLMSTLHVVPTGDVAIREHLGVTTAAEISHPLQPGLHIMWPWPIDRLELIPTEQVKVVTVGTEQPHQSALGPNAFSFWTEHESIPNRELLTGDVNEKGHAAPQLMDGWFSAWWRVKNASDFFQNVSNSRIVAVGGITGTGTKKVWSSMYDALVQQVLLEAITSTFAQHSFHQIRAAETSLVAKQIRTYMQNQLDSMKTGIEVMALSIKDLHPPAGQGSVMTAQGKQLGPAAAYEAVVSAREKKEMLIDNASATATKDTLLAQGHAASVLADAGAYATDLVGVQQGKAKALDARSQAFAENENAVSSWDFFESLKGIFNRVNKVVLGPDVRPPQIWQITRQSGSGPPPAIPTQITGGVGTSGEMAPVPHGR